MEEKTLRKWQHIAIHENDGDAGIDDAWDLAPADSMHNRHSAITVSLTHNSCGDNFTLYNNNNHKFDHISGNYF